MVPALFVRSDVCIVVLFFFVCISFLFLFEQARLPRAHFPQVFH